MFLRRTFSLRTVFIILTALAVLMGYEMNWIVARRAVAARERPASVPEWLYKWSASSVPNDRRSAPGLLWLFGEPGYTRVVIRVDDLNYHDVNSAGHARVEETLKLFPEADVYLNGG